MILIQNKLSSSHICHLQSPFIFICIHPTSIMLSLWGSVSLPLFLFLNFLWSDLTSKRILFKRWSWWRNFEFWCMTEFFICLNRCIHTTNFMFTFKSLFFFRDLVIGFFQLFFLHLFLKLTTFEFFMILFQTFNLLLQML